MIITRECPFTGKTNTKDIPVTEDQLSDWEAGTSIQVAMPDLSPDDREFIMTGITSEVWDEVLGEDS